MQIMDRINVIIKTTNDCNLRCKYCYNSQSWNKKENLPLEKFERLISILSKDFREICLVWHGGEPTILGLEYFERVVEIENLAHQNNGVVIRNSLQTNGSLLNEEWVDFFKKYNFKVGVSFDGKDSDKYRQLGQKTLQNIKLMQKKGLKASCLAVVADDDYDLIENYKFFAEIGCSVEFSYLFMEGAAKNLQGLTKEKFVDKYLKLIDYWFADKNGVDVRLIETYVAMAMGSYYRICTNSSCHGKYLSIYPDGSLYNCGRDNMSNYPFGNIDSINNFNEIYDSQGFKNLVLGSIARRNACKAACEFFDECTGGCADCAITEGTLDQPAKFSCYCFKRIYSYIKEKMQKIKEDKVPLSELNPALARTLKRCFSVSDGNYENLIAEKFI
ncbi:MAG: radical SAM protein [Clostridiales bacterium]|nr:radical SAM protein [Clostridiales bacterium]